MTQNCILVNNTKYFQILYLEQWVLHCLNKISKSCWLKTDSNCKAMWLCQQMEGLQLTDCGKRSNWQMLIKVFKCLICHILITLPISVVTFGGKICCKQGLGCGTFVESYLVNHHSCLLCRSSEIATVQLTNELL